MDHSSGRLDLHSLVGFRGGPHLLITAGVHGDEPEPMEAVRRLAQQVDPAALAGCVTLVPVVNRVAQELRRRVADDGLDLARVCPGKPDGTVTEQSAWQLSQLIRQADYYIDLHTGGAAYLIWPMAGYILHPDESILAKQREMARAFNLPVVWGTCPELQGRSLSVARDANVPAIYCEYLGSDQFQAQTVEPLVTGCLNVMGALGMVDRHPPISAIRWWAEDPAPGSGNMQVAHAAPVAGIFYPLREPGDEISPGQPIGEIEVSVPEKLVLVPARTSGHVLAIHTPGPVGEGDGLGVVVRFSAV